MALQADLSAKLNTGGLLAGLTGNLTTSQNGLAGIHPPAIDRSAFANAGAGASGPGAALSGSVNSIAAQLPAILARIGVPSDVLGPIVTLLELVESVVTADIERQFRELGASLNNQFGHFGDEGFLGALLQAADLFGNSPQATSWKDLFTRLASLAGIPISGASLTAPNIVPGAAALIRLLGGLMAEFTIVSEAQRLAATAALHVDPVRISASTEAVLGFFRPGAPSLEELIASTNTGDAAQVDTAVAAVRMLRLRTEAWAAELTRSLAFGEATMTFMDPPAMQADLAYAAQVIRQADAGALERLFASASAVLGNLLPPGVAGAPQRTLDQFFVEVEARMGDLAAAVNSFDPSAVTAPITRGVNVVMDLPNRLGNAIEEVNRAVSAALEQVRSAIAALPLDAIRNAIRDVVGAVATALRAIADLVSALQNLLDTAARAFRTVLDDTDRALTQFRDAVKALFHDAVQFIEGLHLDLLVSQIAGGAQALAQAIEKASMKPYFDTAAGAIGTAAGIVGNVPFALLPDSMEQEVVDALRPVKTADVGAFKAEIEGLLQIGPDGKFKLRPEIEHAAAEVQQKFDELIAEIRRRDPKTALKAMDQQLAQLGDRIRALSLQVDLAPVRDAVQQVHAAVNAVNPDTILQPLRQGFDQIVARLNEFSPARLIAPVETRWNAARQKVLDLSRLPEWVQTLTDLKQRANQGLDFLDPARFGPNLDAALNDVVSTLDRLPHLHAGSAFGSVIAALYQGSRLRILPLSFEPVLEWMGGQSGTADLLARAAAAVASIQGIGTSLRAIDLPGAATGITQGLQSLRAAVGRLPAGQGRDRIASELDLIDLPRMLAPFQANQTRFFTVLERTANELAQLSAAGFSEADDGVQRLRAAFAPMRSATSGVTAIFGKLGITGFDIGLGEVVKRIVAIAPPSRLIAILDPLIRAAHGRLRLFIDAVIDPLRDAALRLIAIVNSLSLTPLRESLTSIHGAVVAQVAQFHPDQLLAEPLAAFRQLKTEVLAFDPVADIQAIITAVGQAVDRVLHNLNLEDLLAEPLQLYQHILDIISGLRPAALLQPVLDQLDRIATEVDEGLTETVTSFRALQDALPDHIGSTSLTASASVSVN